MTRQFQIDFLKILKSSYKQDLARVCVKCWDTSEVEMRMMFNSKITMMTASMQMSAAAIMLVIPLMLSADTIFHKDGHEVTCKAVKSGDLLSFLPGKWEQFDLTIMHGSHLKYVCLAEKKYEPLVIGELAVLTGFYDCDLRYGAHGIWKYPNNFRVRLFSGTSEAEKDVCKQFIDKHLRLAQ